MKRADTNTIKVGLQKFGDSTQFIDLPEGATVEDLIDRAGLDEGIELRYHGEVVNLDDELEDGDILVIPTKSITQG